MSMDRHEHLRWAKERAFEQCDKGHSWGAWISFRSDMAKHDELRDHIALQLGDMMWAGGMMNTVPDIRKFIDGFN